MGTEYFKGASEDMLQLSGKFQIIRLNVRKSAKNNLKHDLVHEYFCLSQYNVFSLSMVAAYGNKATMPIIQC